jgi:hypothetical protein
MAEPEHGTLIILMVLAAIALATLTLLVGGLAFIHRAMAH